LYQLKIGDNFGFFGNYRVYDFYIHFFDCGFVKMWCSAFIFIFELAVALVNYAAVFAIRVPHLRAVPTAAIGAFYSACEYPDTAVAVFSGISFLHFVLYQIENRRVDYSRMGLFYIVLGNFAIVFLFLFCKEVYGIAFLQQGIALAL